MPGFLPGDELPANIYDYLYELGAESEFTFGEKCEHKSAGQWVALLRGKLYTFEPSTQLQKDIWLDCAKTPNEKDMRVCSLRWFCRKCGTVQKP